MNRLWFVLAFAGVLGCGGGSGSGPDATTTSVAVTLLTPLRMGQTSQASGTATLSNGQTQAVTTGWQSDAPTVASVTSSGTVTGIANGRATIYIVSGGRQGQQLLRVTPDYHGGWEGGVRVKSCEDSGVFEQAKLCDGEVGKVYQFSLSLDQTGESLNATPDYFSDLSLPSATAPINADGTSAFTVNVQHTEEDVTVTIEVTFHLNSTRVGELTGTADELWRVPNIRGEMRLQQDIVDMSRTSVSPLADRRSGGPSKLNLLQRLRLFSGTGNN